jgi:hypothetical protein
LYLSPLYPVPLLEFGGFIGRNSSAYPNNSNPMFWGLDSTTSKITVFNNSAISLFYYPALSETYVDGDATEPADVYGPGFTVDQQLGNVSYEFFNFSQGDTPGVTSIGQKFLITNVSLVVCVIPDECY